MDNRLVIIIKKIGSKIKNANELSTEIINCIADDIKEWQDYKKESKEDEFLNCEEVFDNSADINDNNLIVFELQDGSRWRYNRGNYKCILHPLFSYEDIEVFINLDNENLFKCADDSCGNFLKLAADKVKEYYPDYDGECLLFPYDWTDEGIINWCKKREYNQKEYEKNISVKHKRRIDDLYFDIDCSSCIHMIDEECECHNDDEEECFFYENRN